MFTAKPPNYLQEKGNEARVPKPPDTILPKEQVEPPQQTIVNVVPAETETQTAEPGVQEEPGVHEEPGVIQATPTTPDTSTEPDQKQVSMDCIESFCLFKEISVSRPMVSR